MLSREDKERLSKLNDRLKYIKKAIEYNKILQNQKTKKLQNIDFLLEVKHLKGTLNKKNYKYTFSINGISEDDADYLKREFWGRNNKKNKLEYEQQGDADGDTGEISCSRDYKRLLFINKHLSSNQKNCLLQIKNYGIDNVVKFNHVWYPISTYFAFHEKVRLIVMYNIYGEEWLKNQNKRVISFIKSLNTQAHLSDDIIEEINTLKID